MCDNWSFHRKAQSINIMYHRDVALLVTVALLLRVLLHLCVVTSCSSWSASDSVVSSKLVVSFHTMCLDIGLWHPDVSEMELFV